MPTPTASETVALVVGAGLVGADDVRATIEMHQRSLCYRVDLRDGRALFVKRARRDANGRVGARVAHEGRVLGEIHRRGAPAPRPQLVLDDPDRDVQLFVTEHFAELTPLGELRRTPPGRGAAIGTALGATLAELHATRIEAHRQAALATTDPAASVLAGYVRITPDRYAQLSPAGRRLARRLQTDFFPEHLDAIAAGWAASALVHGDVKSDNVLARPGQDPAVQLVDWELAGWGDPDADLGWLVGDAYAAWLTGMRFTSHGTLVDWVASATVPLTELMTQVRAALREYCRRRAVAADAPRRWTRYAGLFLVHRACAAARFGDELTPLALACLQVGGELLLDPTRGLELLP